MRSDSPNLDRALNPLPSRNLPPNLTLRWRLVVAILLSVLFTLQSKVDGTLGVVPVESTVAKLSTHDSWSSPSAPSATDRASRQHMRLAT